MEDFIFLHQKKKNNNKVLLPISYDRDENSIPGVYTTSSIRFYKKRIDEIVNYETLHMIPNLDNKKIRFILRYLHSSMANFDIEERYIKLKGLGTVQEKDFDFKSGIIIVKNEHFMDIISKNNVKEYLKKYGFDESKENEILETPKLVLSRVPDKKLNYNLKH